MTNNISALIVERERERERKNRFLKSSSTSISYFKQFSAFLFLFFFPNFLFAAGGTGLTKVDNFFSTVNGWLSAAGVLIMTGAIMVAGYKVMFGGQAIREVTPIVLGGILIGGAAMIAGMLL